MQSAGTSENPPTFVSRAPTVRPLWACIELLVAGVLIVAGLRLPIIIFRFGSAPWLVLTAGLLLWWRKVGLGAIGLGRPSSLPRTLAIGLLVGVSYQFVGTFVVEPMIGRLTTGELPDVSGFRSLIGDTGALVYWTAYAWLLAAVLEEIAYRGWILTRMAELGRFSGSSLTGATLASSVVFGLIHEYQGISGMIATGLSGLVFAAVYLGSGRNLWAAIIAHGVMDTTGFVMIYLGVYPGL